MIIFPNLKLNQLQSLTVIDIVIDHLQSLTVIDIVIDHLQSLTLINLVLLIGFTFRITCVQIVIELHALINALDGIFTRQIKHNLVYKR